MNKDRSDVFVKLGFASWSPQLISASASLGSKLFSITSPHPKLMIGFPFSILRVMVADVKSDDDENEEVQRNNKSSSRIKFMIFLF